MRRVLELERGYMWCTTDVAPHKPDPEDGGLIVTMLDHHTPAKIEYDGPDGPVEFYVPIRALESLAKYVQECMAWERKKR